MQGKIFWALYRLRPIEPIRPTRQKPVEIMRRRSGFGGSFLARASRASRRVSRPVVHFRGFRLRPDVMLRGLRNVAPASVFAGKFLSGVIDTYDSSSEGNVVLASDVEIGFYRELC